MAIDDLNGDGKPDLVSANNQANTVSIFKNNGQIGTISFSGKTDFNAGLAPQNVVIGDLDGDGKPDMAVTNYVANTITLLRNTENDSLSPRIYSFSPDSGATGTNITVIGIHFTGTTSVIFGGVPASSFLLTSDTSITAVVAAGASGNLSVTTPDGTSAMGVFRFIPARVDSVFRLIQFSGNQVNGHAQLQWHTANEQSITEYIVEYSTDNLSYSAIDSLKNSGMGSYLFTDPQLLDSNNYFRLKIIDTLGNPTYSYIVKLHVPAIVPKTNGLVLNPNPAKGTVLAKFPVSTMASSLTLTDMTGKKVRMISLDPNVTQTLVDLTNLIPGVYIMVWRNGSLVFKQSLLVE